MFSSLKLKLPADRDCVLSVFGGSIWAFIEGLLSWIEFSVFSSKEEKPLNITWCFDKEETSSGFYKNKQNKRQIQEKEDKEKKL